MKRGIWIFTETCLNMKHSKVTAVNMNLFCLFVTRTFSSLKIAKKYMYCRHMDYFGPVSYKVEKLIDFIPTAHNKLCVSL